MTTQLPQSWADVEPHRDTLVMRRAGTNVATYRIVVTGVAPSSVEPLYARVAGERLTMSGVRSQRRGVDGAPPETEMLHIEDIVVWERQPEPALDDAELAQS